MSKCKFRIGDIVTIYRHRNYGQEAEIVMYTPKLSRPYTVRWINYWGHVRSTSCAAKEMELVHPYSIHY